MPQRQFLIHFFFFSECWLLFIYFIDRYRYKRLYFSSIFYIIFRTQLNQHDRSGLSCIITLMIQLYMLSSPSSRDHIYYMIQNFVEKVNKWHTKTNKWEDANMTPRPIPWSPSRTLQWQFDCSEIHPRHKHNLSVTYPGMNSSIITTLGSWPNGITATNC